MKSAIAIVIVDYGSLKESIKYANHIDSKVKESTEIIIVDVFEHYRNIENLCDIYDYVDFCGNKIKVEKLVDCTTDIFIIRLNVNVGFARGNNIGFRFSVDKLKAQYVIFSNNDIEIPEQICFSEIEKYFLLNEKCCLYGPKIIDNSGYPQGPFQRGNFINYLFFMEIDRTFKNFYRILKRKINGKINYPESGDYFTIQGCFMITKSSRFERIGLFDENTFLYREEEILGERMRCKHLLCHYDANIVVIHKEEGTISKVLLPIKSKKMLFESACYYFHQYRNVNKIVIDIARLNFKYLYTPFYNIAGKFWKIIKRLLV